MAGMIHSFSTLIQFLKYFLFLNITLSLGFSFENFFILQVENSLLIEMSALTTFPPLFISTVNGIFLYKALIKIKQRAVGVSSWLQVFLKSTCVKLHLIFFLDLNNQNRSLYSGYTSQLRSLKLSHFRSFPSILFFTCDITLTQEKKNQENIGEKWIAFPHPSFHIYLVTTTADMACTIKKTYKSASHSIIFSKAFFFPL